MNRLTSLRNVLLRSALLLPVLVASACNVSKSVDDIIAEVDKTRQTVAQESAGWRDEIPKLVNSLNGMEGKISADAKSILADTTSQVQDLSTQLIQLTDAKAQDLISQAGVEFRCNADFVKSGAVAQLQAIVDDLKFWKQNKSHSGFKPSHNVCWINPSSLQLYSDGNNWLVDTNTTGGSNIVHVFGYNFWPEALPRLELQNAGGQTIRTLSLQPAYVTHYQVNLDFSAADLHDVQSGARLVFRWPDVPDPNTISLVLRQPASLTITGVSFNKSSPVATQDPVFPTVTIANVGGSDSDRFSVVWMPAPNAAPQSVSVNQAIHAGASITVQFPGYAYPVCGPFVSNVSLSNGGASRNDTITVAPYCPTLPGAPEKRLQDKDITEGLSNSLSPIGSRADKPVGDVCDSGYHRSKDPVVTPIAQGGPGSKGCSFNSWVVSNDTSSCKAFIHFYADAYSEIVCNVQIWEIGNSPPPGPACTCQP